jgi:hypothetical protein
VHSLKHFVSFKYKMHIQLKMALEVPLLSQYIFSECLC